MLLTADDIVRRAHYRNAQRTLDRLLAARRRAGRQRERHRGHRTRSGSATTTGSRRWSPTSCTPTRWCCSPTSTASTTGRRRRPGARRIARGPRPGRPRRPSTSAARGSAVGTGGMVTKLEAARDRDRRRASPTLLTLAAPGSARRSPARTSAPGSTATGRRTSARRLLWLAHAARPRAACVLDAGAVRAVARRRRVAAARRASASVEGDFDAGDPVDLCDETARGGPRAGQLLDASELPALLGRSTTDLRGRAAARGTTARSSTATSWCCCTGEQHRQRARGEGGPWTVAPPTCPW